MATVTIFLAAAAVSYLVAALAGAVGPRVGLVDLPDGDLKTHSKPIPPLGGLGVLAGLLVGMWAGGIVDWSTVVAVVMAAGLGLADDRMDLSPRLRLAVETVIGVVLVAGPLIGNTIGPLEAILGAAATIVLINAVNLYDGLDGLVTASASLGLLGLLLYPAWARDHRLLLLVGAGAMLGFLPHNWRPARMFLGDNGSYTIGTLLGAVVVQGGVAGRGPLDMIAVAACATVFLVDLGSTMLRRRRAGMPLFIGDRSHTYDRLHDGGWSVPRIALVSAGVNGASAAAVALLAGVGVPVASAAAVLLVLGLIAVAVAR